MATKIPCCLCLLGLLLAGCGQQNYPGPKRYPLSGKVAVDGQPMDWGSISFLPASDGAARVSGGLIADGAYSVTEEMGPTAGKYRVEIRWGKLTGKKKRDPDSGEMFDERKEALPARFHEQSELTAEVSDKQKNFDFNLNSR